MILFDTSFSYFIYMIVINKCLLLILFDTSFSYFIYIYFYHINRIFYCKLDGPGLSALLQNLIYSITREKERTQKYVSFCSENLLKNKFYRIAENNDNLILSFYYN